LQFSHEKYTKFANFARLYNISQPNFAIIYLLKNALSSCGDLFASRPDFEGRCGEVRTSPEIVLHLP
jgi:hypothetical protein